MNDYRGCPLSGKLCAGPEHCAPAVMCAERANSARQEGIEEMASALCPIVVSLESLMIVSQALLPLVLGPPIDPEEDKPKSRDEILSDLKLDQG